jgi:hypothetical protein
VAKPVVVRIAPPPTSKKEICTDGVDNDGDGRVDCDDPDCAEGCQEICTDGVDNDGDGRVDCDDPDCAEGCQEICNDDVDNDRDGRVDCDDPDCKGKCEPWWRKLVVPLIFLFFGAAGVGAIWQLYLRSLPAAAGRLESDHLPGGHLDMATKNKHHLVLGTGAEADVKLLLDTKLAGPQADLLGVRVQGFPFTKIVNRSQAVSMQIQERHSEHPNTKTEHILRNGDTILFDVSERPEKVTLTYKRAGEPPDSQRRFGRRRI